MSYNNTAPKKELLPFQKENVSTQQQNIPLPFLGGTRVIAVRWISPAIDQINVPVPGGGKKGGGGGGKKGGSKQSSKYVHGTLAGAICHGPLDWLRGVIYNGGYLWQGNLTLTSDVTDLTGSIADPLYLAAGGFLHLHRGTGTQPRGLAFPNDPPYLWTTWIEAKHLLFGQDSGAAPNLQLIGGRIPRVPTSIVAAEHNVADDDQINPVAFWAELLLHEAGGDLPEDAFDTQSWLDSAEWAYTNRDIIFCSPLLNEQSALRAIAKRLLDPFNGFCRWNSSGQLACRIYEWGVDPGGLPVLDARHLKKKLPMMFGDWKDIPTEYVVDFTNRDFEFQEDAVVVPDQRAAHIRQVTDQRRVARPDITRRVQAALQGNEFRRRVATAPTRATLDVPRAFAESLNIYDKLKLDVDPQPGGTGLAQLARVERIRTDSSDVAKVEVTTDNLAPATLYNPGDETPTPPEDTSPAMQHFLAVPLPPAAFGWPLSVAVLATRPNRSVWGMDVFFSDDTASHPFDQLGTQYDFACRAQLAANITSGATTMNLTELDGATGPEATLAANTPGGNATAAKNDTLLVLLAQLDGNGRVALDGNGDPIMEFISIVDRSLVSGATYSYTVLRGRLDTPARAWTSGAVAWIVPRGHLMEWESTLLGTLAGSVAYFRLVSFTHAAEDETTPVPECSVNMIPTTAPMYQRGLEGANSASVFIYQRAASAPTLPSASTVYSFATGVLTGLNNGWSQTIPAGTNPLYVSIAAAIATGPTDTIAASEWSTARVLAQNGTDGADGADGSDGINSATVFIYKRAASSPTLPSALTTYTFATGVLTGLNNGWSQAVPASNGQPLWVAAATASSASATDSIASGEWAAPVIFVNDGTDGVDGADGKVIEFVWKRASSQPAAPSGNGVPAGWSDDPPAGSDPLWMSKAKQELDGTLVSGESWSTPIRHDGPPGTNGANGANGTDGANGINSASVFIYKRAASAPTLPSADTTYTFATGVLSGLNNGWTQGVPSGDDPLYVSTATAASSGASDTILSSEWAAATILAQNGAPGGAAAPAPGVFRSDVSTVQISAPASPPSGYWVQYSIDGGSPSAPNTGLPFFLSLTMGQELLYWAGAPGYTQSAVGIFYDGP